MRSGIKRYLLGLVLLMAMPLCAEVTWRGAWIATVANIDWPSREAIGNAEKQQAEMIWMLDSLESLGMNAIVFQVRPTADALYESELEPWSHWISGKQGHWSDSIDGYDPLSFVVMQAHMRNMEVHAWVNPYRVNIASMDTSVLHDGHLMKQHPDWFWQYGKQWYFDPAKEETRDWLCMVVEDIVCRYGVDAIHMDDYFYPYPIGKKELPDRESFEKDPRGFENIGDWRRDNVNKTIQALSETIKRTKQDVEFGISPFGVWRNYSVDTTGSRTQAGMTNYDDLYADVLLWLREGWIDYVVPQLYWEIGKKVADYEELVHWWARNSYGRKLYIGMAPYRLGGTKENKAWKEGNEIARQMRMNRTVPEVTGECFYSTQPLLKNPLGVCDSIKAFSSGSGQVFEE